MFLIQLVSLDQFLLALYNSRHLEMEQNDTGKEPRKTAINPIFDKLITSLRTALDNDGTLDKESTSYNDIFDAFRLALKFYHFRDSNDF